MEKEHETTDFGGDIEESEHIVHLESNEIHEINNLESPSAHFKM